MISNLSFKGNVFLTGDTKYISHKSEVELLKGYADVNNLDVVVLNRDYYSNGSGRYDTLTVKVDETTGTNNISKKTFDFKKGVKI